MFRCCLPYVLRGNLLLSVTDLLDLVPISDNLYSPGMPRFQRYLYQTASGVEVVANKLASLARSTPKTFQAIQTGLEMLSEFGPQPGLNKFKRLRYIEGSVELWELRTQVRPAYRVLFSPVPGEDAFVVLHVVSKDEMASAAQQHIERALRYLDHWLAEVHPAAEGQL